MRRMIIPINFKPNLVKLQEALISDKAQHLWVVGNFNCSVDDSKTYYTDGAGYKTCDEFEKRLRCDVRMIRCTDPPVYAVEIWDGKNFYCNIPDYIDEQHEYGEELANTPYLDAIRDVLRKHDIDRVYACSKFTGKKEDRPMLALETYDNTVVPELMNIIGDDADTDDYAAGCFVTYYTDMHEPVIYEKGKFYANEG